MENISNVNLNTQNRENLLSKNDIETLKKVRKYSKGAAICCILCFLLIPIFIAMVYSILACVKVFDVRNEETRNEIKVAGILTIFFPIIAGFILSSKTRRILIENNEF